MGVKIVTKEDLPLFRMQLADDFKSLIVQIMPAFGETNLEGYKTRHVRKLLDCSTNKLQSLRIAGKLGFKKVGGTIIITKRMLND